MKVKERLWFIHKEFLVGLWWKLRSPNSWSNGLTTKPSLLTSCTSTLQVDVGVMVTVWTHSFSFLSLWQWAGCAYARFLVCLLSWACSEAWVGKGKLKLTSWSRGFENYDLWLAVAICKMLLELVCFGLPLPSTSNVCGSVSLRRYAISGKLSCHLAFHRVWDTGIMQSRLKAIESTCFLVLSPYMLLNTETGESTGILST